MCYNCLRYSGENITNSPGAQATPFSPDVQRLNHRGLLSALCGVHTTTKSPKDTLLRTIPVIKRVAAVGERTLGVGPGVILLSSSSPRRDGPDPEIHWDDLPCETRTSL